MTKIRFGVNEPTYLFDPRYLKETALQLENLGYYSLWVADRLAIGKYPRFEPFTLLSALSLETKKIRLGTMVACNSYRNPALTAKITSTLDVISNGRLILGYGAGANLFTDEYEAYGYPFPKPNIRIKQMREGIIIIKKLWTEEKASFKGDFYNVKDAICEPKPVQKPHPPIIVGGEGESIMKTTAELADGWNCRALPIEEYKRRVDILTKYCDEYGRRIEDLELTWGGQAVFGEDREQVKRKIERYMSKYPMLASWIQGHLLGGGCTFDECIGVLQRYVDLGCRHFIFSGLTFSEEKEAFMERVGSSF
jgi:alkanesulfonate monooxygenase SsuD/methylene tetrahydromethanopterin reductase-like flavin-dependent oxidoreductase (luciferase family)